MKERELLLIFLFQVELAILVVHYIAKSSWDSITVNGKMYHINIVFKLYE